MCCDPPHIEQCKKKGSEIYLKLPRGQFAVNTHEIVKGFDFSVAHLR